MNVKWAPDPSDGEHKCGGNHISELAKQTTILISKQTIVSQNDKLYLHQ